MNNAKKMARRLVLLVVSVELLITIPKERVIRMFHILIERQYITNPEYLSFLWRVDKESLLITAGFALLLIVAVINLLGFFSVLVNPTGPDLPASGSAQTNAGRIQRQPAQRTTQSTADKYSKYRQAKQSGQTGKTRQATKYSQPKQSAQYRQPRQYQDPQASNAIIYKTGKERYMEQLENFLKDGVVTRSEYLELKRQYEKMDWGRR